MGKNARFYFSNSALKRVRVAEEPFRVITVWEGWREDEVFDAVSYLVCPVSVGYLGRLLAEFVCKPTTQRTTICEIPCIS